MSDWHEYNNLLTSLPPAVAADLARIAATGGPTNDDRSSDVSFTVSMNEVARVLIQTRRKVARDYLIAGCILFGIAAAAATTVIVLRLF